jgi:hypothetical protein
MYLKKWSLCFQKLIAWCETFLPVKKTLIYVAHKNPQHCMNEKAKTQASESWHHYHSMHVGYSSLFTNPWE